MTKGVSLRIDLKLHAEIVKLAIKNERSINSELIVAIKKYVKDNK